MNGGGRAWMQYHTQFHRFLFGFSFSFPFSFSFSYSFFLIAGFMLFVFCLKEHLLQKINDKKNIYKIIILSNFSSDGFLLSLRKNFLLEEFFELGVSSLREFI